MKTEQDIMQMVSTCNNYYGCGACPYNPEDLSMYIGDKWKGGCPNYDRKLVYAMGKGYGDVSEYKAEIERLKAENEKLLDSIESVQAGRYLEQQVKQAKIDVLNKLKSSAVYDDNYLDGYVFIDDVNKLIEEVQDAEDKG